MSNVKVNTLTSVDGTVSVDVKDLANTVTEILGIDKKQLATAWVNFDGVNGAIKDSYNCSVVRTAVGTFDITFTTAMDHDGYSLVSSCVSLTASTMGAIQTESGELMSARTVNGTTVIAGVVSSAVDVVDDTQSVSVQVFGGKN